MKFVILLANVIISEAIVYPMKFQEIYSPIANIGFVIIILFALIIDTYEILRKI